MKTTNKSVTTQSSFTCNRASSPFLNSPAIEPWPEPVKGALLLDELVSLFQRFVVLPIWAPETLSLWVLHSYAFDLRTVSTYIGLESPEKRCGKTTVLAVLSELVHRPVVAANISPPALFRVIEDLRPTLLIDEADTLLQGNDELRGILNSGYSRKTAFVVRVAAASRPSQQHRARKQAHTYGSGPGSSLASPLDTRAALVRFSCWCPKAMAAIGRLPETLADRCIVIPMRRKTQDEQCERLRELDATILRRRCLRFVQDNAKSIASARPKIPHSLNDRAADIWEPLLAIADLATGAWPKRARHAAIALSSMAQETNPTTTLLLDLLVLCFETDGDRIFSRTLVDGLNSKSDQPWAQAANRKEITEHWLSHKLRPYGLRPRTMRISGAQAKGYIKADLIDLFRRYIPRAAIQELLADHQPSQEPASEHRPDLPESDTVVS